MLKQIFRAYRFLRRQYSKIREVIFLKATIKSFFLTEGIEINFVQDNQASSSFGVIRGLHYQLEPHAQTKLIRVLSGTILDAVVDIRKNSPTYGKAYTIELSAENKKQLLIPKGFAHGYSVISETAEVFYKCDAFYHKESEGGIAWNDPSLNINWQIPTESVKVSEKDSNYSSLENCKNNFVFK